jgi:hypothetical protein
MSDFGTYYGSFESAIECEAKGDLLMAAIEYWMCIQYSEHGEFPVVPDTFLESKAHDKLRKLQSKLPYAPLSKTSFIKGCQCLKALWLYRNKYDQRFVSDELQKKFNTGHTIGELAQHLFPSGTNASAFPELQHQLKILQGKTPLQVPNLPYKLKQNLWLRQTQEALKDSIKDIYEAAFTFNDVFAAVDILHTIEDGYVAYEVKSSFDVKDVYIHDCALQYYVMSHNVALQDIFLVYPDENYVNSLGIGIDDLTIENCDIQKLFIKKSILNEVLALQSTVEEELKTIKPILSQRNEPRIAIGDQCNNPYGCDFLRYCTINSKQK